MHQIDFNDPAMLDLLREIDRLGVSLPAPPPAFVEVPQFPVIVNLAHVAEEFVMPDPIWEVRDKISVEDSELQVARKIITAAAETHSMIGMDFAFATWGADRVRTVDPTELNRMGLLDGKSGSVDWPTSFHMLMTATKSRIPTMNRAERNGDYRRYHPICWYSRDWDYHELPCMRHFRKEKNFYSFGSGHGTLGWLVFEVVKSAGGPMSYAAIAAAIETYYSHIGLKFKDDHITSILSILNDLSLFGYTIRGEITQKGKKQLRAVMLSPAVQRAL